ncbi:MAG: hypothetical protein CSB24_06280 [Deltaproteobacteria bacterium]|nr:MAG: hypothetical protein CSB24_06280 [Deltaproteobacteria bacterium]
MWNDPIVKETRKQRNLYAAEHNHDIDTIFQDILEREKLSKKKIIVMPSRKIVSLDNNEECWK